MHPRITRVETAAVRAVGPSVLVRIWAGDTYGLGECYPSAPAAAVHQIIAGFGEHLYGRDPRDVVRLAESLRRWHIFTGAQAGTVVTAISGVELALWDLAGKLQGVPVWALLGGRFRDEVRLYADCNAGTVDAAGHHPHDGLPDPDDDDGRRAIQAAADRAISLGFDAVKFDVDDVFAAGSVDPWNRELTSAQIRRMTEQVRLMRECVGADVSLAIDMHARYNQPSAIRACRALEDFDLAWIEEPTPPENLDALAEVRRATTAPICAGENLYTRYPFRDLLAARAVDIVMPDLAKCGGLWEGKRIADLAELSYIPFAPHNVSSPIGTIAAAHLCATVANFTTLEWHAIDLAHWHDLVTYAGGPVIDRGRIRLTDAPGLGLELNEDIARAHEHVKAGISFFGEAA
jgi:galactonate dehydratase